MFSVRLKIGDEPQPGGGCKRRMPSSSCSAMDSSCNRRLGLKLSGSQKMQPRVDSLPSRFGQVQPASRLTFQTGWPNLLRQKKLGYDNEVRHPPRGGVFGGGCKYYRPMVALELHLTWEMHAIWIRTKPEATRELPCTVN